jgi:hypothetical protein
VRKVQKAAGLKRIKMAELPKDELEVETAFLMTSFIKKFYKLRGGG